MNNSKYLWSYDDMGTPIEELPDQTFGLCAHNDYLKYQDTKKALMDTKKAVTKDNHSPKPKNERKK